MEKRIESEQNYEQVVSDLYRVRLELANEREKHRKTFECLQTAQQQISDLLKRHAEERAQLCEAHRSERLSFLEAMKVSYDKGILNADTRFAEKFDRIKRHAASL